MILPRHIKMIKEQPQQRNVTMLKCLKDTYMCALFSLLLSAKNKLRHIPIIHATGSLQSCKYLEVTSQEYTHILG